MRSGTSQYNKLIYESGPIKVSDFLSNIPNKIHQEMFENAMQNFYQDYPEFKDNKNIKVIEIKDKEFWKFPKIRIIDYTKKPLKQYEFSLDNYWDNVYVKKEDDGSIPEVLGGNNTQLDFLDYIHGKATMLDRHTNDKYKVDFKDLGKNIEVSDEFNAYKETFEYRQKYGNNV